MKHHYHHIATLGLLMLLGIGRLCAADWFNAVRSWPFIVVPSVAYSPETDWGFGLGGAGYFALPSDPLGRTSELGFDGDYTLNGMWHINLTSTMYLTDRWQLRFRLGYRSYPDVYYGLGNTPQDYEIFNLDEATWQMDLPAGYTSRRAYLYAEPMYRAKGNWWVGAVVNMQYEGNCVRGNRWLIPGVGFSSLYDSRDVLYFPSQGIFFKTQAQLLPTLYNDGTGRLNSLRMAERVTIDFRHYITLYKQLIFAYQLYGDAYFGGSASYPAPEMLPTLGGQDMLRGVRKGMWRDNLMVCGQAELRIPIYRILRGTIFAGVGDVYNIYDWHWATPKVGYGLGLRLCFHQAGINIRADIARNNYDKAWNNINNYSFYLTIKEAF